MKAKGHARTLRNVFALSLLTACASLGQGCSVLADVDITQCNVTADCVKLGFEGMVCNEQHVCALKGGCSRNQDCIDANGGQPFICRKADRSCVSLASTDCTKLISDPSDVANDNTVWLGLLTPASHSLTVPTWNTVGIARQEFATIGAGLPPTVVNGPRRPLAFINCDTEKDVLRATRYLVDDVRVPAIIGPYYSADVLKIAPQVTIPAGVMLMSTSATSPLITGLPNDNPRLVWRTAGSDTNQGIVLASLVEHNVEAAVRAANLLGASDALKVALLYRNDAYGQGLSTVFTQNVKINGKTPADNGANFQPVSYGSVADPSNTDPAAQYLAAARAVLNLAPDIVVVMGGDEAAKSVIPTIESQWPAARSKPFYAMSEGVKTNILQGLVGADTTFMKRILGAAPGSTGPLVQAVNSKYQASVKDGTQPGRYSGAVYDAVYALAYGIVAVGGEPLTGANIARQMSKLVPPAGLTVDVGPENLFTAYTVLGQGRGFDFNGAYGPQDFDLKTGEARTDIQVWCMTGDAASPGNQYVNSGLFFSAATGELSGTISHCLP